MPFISDELSVAAKGGTELMRDRINQVLVDNCPRQWGNVNIYNSRVRNFDSTKKNIYYLHDLPDDPESQHLAVDGGKRFDVMVFVSHWQHQAYNNRFKIDPSVKQLVIPNAINPIKPDDNKWSEDNDTINIIYHTTPHRGLNILEWWASNIMPDVQKKTKKKIHLHVYSSFAVYGWQQRDEQYRDIFDRLKSNPNVTYYGAQHNINVRNALAKAHLFAYPCIWPETFCLAAVEAISSAALVVTSNLAALPEITGSYNSMLLHTSDLNRLASDFAHMINQSIQTIDQEPSQCKTWTAVQKQRVDLIYNWEYVQPQWIQLITHLGE